MPLFCFLSAASSADWLRRFEKYDGVVGLDLENFFALKSTCRVKMVAVQLPTLSQEKMTTLLSHQARLYTTTDNIIVHMLKSSVLFPAKGLVFF